MSHWNNIHVQSIGVIQETVNRVDVVINASNERKPIYCQSEKRKKETFEI